MLTRRIRGVTLIEMLIGLAILALLLSLGVPSFMVWMQNQQVRNAADAVLNGMQLARAEAIRRNKLVEFALGDKSSWVVKQVNPEIEVQRRAAEEGSANVDVTATPGGAYAVTFDAMGARVDNADTSNSVTSLEFASPVSNSAIRRLRIVISVAGTVRMCDPDPNLKAGDPRRCSA